MEPDGNRIFLHPGDLFVAEREWVLTTILGSCVSVVLWDRKQRIGGMNHFVLPVAPEGECSCRYGDVSIRTLAIRMKKLGCTSAGLDASIVGGGNPVRELRGPNAVGPKNVSLAEEILGRLRIPIVMADTGGQMGRKVWFEVRSGKVEACSLAAVRATDWYEENGGPGGKPDNRLPFTDRRRIGGAPAKEPEKSGTVTP